MNVIGEPIDERGPIPTDKLAPIHAEAPEFVDMSVEQEILVTGIKVSNLTFWVFRALFTGFPPISGGRSFGPLRQRR